MFIQTFFDFGLWFISEKLLCLVHTNFLSLWRLWFIREKLLCLVHTNFLSLWRLWFISEKLLCLVHTNFLSLWRLWFIREKLLCLVHTNFLSLWRLWFISEKLLCLVHTNFLSLWRLWFISEKLLCLVHTNFFIMDFGLLVKSYYALFIQTFFHFWRICENSTLISNIYSHFLDVKHCDYTIWEYHIERNCQGIVQPGNINTNHCPNNSVFSGMLLWE